MYASIHAIIQVDYSAHNGKEPQGDVYRQSWILVNVIKL